MEACRSAPTFERIAELVRLCGFDLDVRLALLDDSDWSVAAGALRRTPAERVRDTMNAVRFADAARAAMLDAT